VVEESALVERRGRQILTLRRDRIAGLDSPLGERP
jgi:hypothetical protein